MLPESVLNCMKRGSERFYRDLNALDWPSADRDAPAKEANIVFHIGRELSLLANPFHVYLEAASVGRGSMDLLACDGRTALALEAKCFGNIGSYADCLAGQVDRMKQFNPRYAKRADPSLLKDLWQKASCRIGLIVIASFRGDEVASAWKSGDSSLLDSKDRPGFDGLLRHFKSADRITWPVNGGRDWKSCGSIHILLGAFNYEAL